MAAAGVNQGTYPVNRVCVFYFWDLRHLSVPRTFVRNRKDGQKEGTLVPYPYRTVTGRSSVPEPLRPFNDQSIVITPSQS